MLHFSNRYHDLNSFLCRRDEVCIVAVLLCPREVKLVLALVLVITTTADLAIVPLSEILDLLWDDECAVFVCRVPPHVSYEAQCLSEATARSIVSIRLETYPTHPFDAPP